MGPCGIGYGFINELLEPCMVVLIHTLMGCMHLQTFLFNLHFKLQNNCVHYEKGAVNEQLFLCYEYHKWSKDGTVLAILPATLWDGNELSPSVGKPVENKNVDPVNHNLLGVFSCTNATNLFGTMTTARSNASLIKTSRPIHLYISHKSAQI